jgi:serralysin
MERAAIGHESSRCRIESLEPRQLFSGTAPTADEQYMLELINRARANPTAEASMEGISLNEGLAAGTISTAAKQPLAFNPDLISSALGHSQWMIANQLFQHDGPGTTDPGQRMTEAGYNFTGSYGWGENIAEEGSTGAIDTTPTTNDEENNLFIDSSEPGRGHRVNIENPDYKEIGVGIATGTFDGYNAELVTQDFAYSQTDSFLTGVAFNDSVKADNFYEPGEGLGSLTITAKRASDGAVFSTQTWASGGYTLALSPGTYQITASGTGLLGVLNGGTVSIGQQNVEVDFNSIKTPLLAAPPTARLTAKNLYAAASVYTFTITYSASDPLNTSTFDKHDLLITGPNGYRGTATFVASKSSNGGKTQTVTYHLSAPNKTWRSADSGVYHVYVRSNQVADQAGDFVTGALLGYFKVLIA